jgi:hypothetical protein
VVVAVITVLEEKEKEQKDEKKKKEVVVELRNSYQRFAIKTVQDALYCQPLVRACIGAMVSDASAGSK